MSVAAMLRSLPLVHTLAYQSYTPSVAYAAYHSPDPQQPTIVPDPQQPTIVLTLVGEDCAESRSNSTGRRGEEEEEEEEKDGTRACILAHGCSKTIRVRGGKGGGACYRPLTPAGRQTIARYRADNLPLVIGRGIYMYA